MSEVVRSSLVRAWCGSHPLCDELGHHITSVHVNGAQGHDLLPVPAGQLSQKQVDQGVQLGDLGEGR